nr:hypothetical protein [Variovorax boronicumulans]
MKDSTPDRQNVDQQLAVLRSQMPDVYKSIQAEAAARGRVVYEWVRRALRGEPDLFYAFERGYVMGTPFSDPTVMGEIAACMVAFGRCSVCIFARPGTEAAHGAD